MTKLRWPVVRYNGARDNRPKADEWGADELMRHLCWPSIWSRAKIDVPAWSPVEMVPGATRANENVIAVSMLVLDCDQGEPIEVLESLGDEFIRLGHTSWSHRPDHPKARLVFPFARPCPLAHWPQVWRAASRWAAANGVTIDAAVKDASRIYFEAYVPWQAGEPGGNVHLEHFESWAYENDPTDSFRAPAALPGRPRRLMEWAHLACEFPDPVERNEVRIITAGRADERLDFYGKRKRAFALAMLRHRCQLMVIAGEGGKGAQTGRNNRTFAAARLVARLTLAGCIDESEGIEIVSTAAENAGLSRKEYSRAIRNGLAAGVADGPEDIDRYLTRCR